MTNKTFDLFHYIFWLSLGVGMMLLMIHLSGEVHGLIITVMISFGLIAHLNVRCTALQRQINILFQEQDLARRSGSDKV
jgi:hypothetical protein